MKHVRIIHGPNLDLLGQREIHLYGTMTLDDLNRKITEYADSIGVNVSFYQSNDESCIIDSVRTACNECDVLIINPAGLGYSSLALRDAVIMCGIPVLEVHLSNLQSREKFRHKTMITDVCAGQISGFKELSYLAALLVAERLPPGR